MTDYKHIHARFQREDHDYRQGWAHRETISGVWLAIGVGLGMILVILAGVQA